MMIGMLNIVEAFGTHCTTAAPGRRIEYIAIHYTAGTVSRKGAAANTAAYFASANARGAADFIVDDETVVQYNGDLENRYCWAVGDRALRIGKLYGIAGNRNTVSLEICSRNTTGQVRAPNDLSWKLTEAAVDNAVELTAELMKRYGVPLENVVRHYDISGKLCPGVYGWNPDSGSEEAWQAFKERLEEFTVKRYNTMAEIEAAAPWAVEKVQRLIWAKKLNGKDGGTDAKGNPTGLDLSEDMLRLITLLG